MKSLWRNAEWFIFPSLVKKHLKGVDVHRSIFNVVGEIEYQ